MLLPVRTVSGLWCMVYFPNMKMASRQIEESISILNNFFPPNRGVDTYLSLSSRLSIQFIDRRSTATGGGSTIYAIVDTPFLLNNNIGAHALLRNYFHRTSSAGC